MIEITIESTKPITADKLSDKKLYAFFNSSSFFTLFDGKLKCLAQPLTQKAESWFYVAEGGSENIIMDFFNSGQWRYTKCNNYY